MGDFSLDLPRTEEIKKEVERNWRLPMRTKSSLIIR